MLLQYLSAILLPLKFMKIIKKFNYYFLSIVLAFSFLLNMFAVGVNAANLQDAFSTANNSNLGTVAQGAGYDSSTDKDTAYTFVSSVIQVALSLLGVIFLVLMIYGGYLWMTDRGNADQVEKAKKIIQAAIIGLIIVLASYAITYFVFENLQNSLLNTGVTSE